MSYLKNLDEMIQEYHFVQDAIEALKFVPTCNVTLSNTVKERLLREMRIRQYEREAIYRCIEDVIELIPLSQLPYIPDELKY